MRKEGLRFCSRVIREGVPLWRGQGEDSGHPPPHPASGGHLQKTLLLWFLFISISITCNAQVYLYFQDSPSADYYDYSWMELTSPSELERKGDDLRKFPVESVIAPAQGMNSLRLKWKSVTGGDWVAIAAGTDWIEKNISSTDTMQFWIYSLEGIDSANLPRIFMEDISNVKTTKHLFSKWCNDLAAAQWVSVKIPMVLFLGASDPVDFTRIKTIGFGQNTDDALQHTLLIDNMRVFTGSGTSPVPSRPGGLSAEGFDSHVELRWHPNPEAYVSGYSIQRSSEGVNSFTNIAVRGKDDTLFVDHVADLGTAVTVNYRIMALNGSGEMSAPSDTVEASTRVFSDDELLDMVQQYTFRYFWDFADPASGMARERNTSGATVTSGGSGFGIMAMIVGIERGFITRDQGIARMQKILTFLENADRFHGAWPHWIDGNTGHVIPFSPQDNGGDLVETGFLVQGLLAARNYFNQDTPSEQEIAQIITDLWEAVEWDWYRQNDSDVLYWHWSPDNQWAINMQIRGWNEAAIIYILAIASPTHGIPAGLWETGWAGNPDYVKGKSFYGYKLDVGWDKGGPLFFAHYSFLGFDPRYKKDAYANYFINNRNHTLINRAYCIDNPQDFTGYGENCWGLTASDDPDGYMAHEPASGRDNGTITPTASLSSMPYTPAESLNALKFLYRNLGKKIWGPMGFYDAFNQKRNWYATSYLAIDQGPVMDMIENYRSQLLWNNFMANPEIQKALDDIGFTEDLTTRAGDINTGIEILVMPNPMGQNGIIKFNLKQPGLIGIYLNDLSGRTISVAAGDIYFTEGNHEVSLDNTGVAPGIYFLKIVTDNTESQIIKLIIQ